MGYRTKRGKTLPRRREPFALLYRRLRKDILRTAQRVPGLLPDEVQAEMIESLWRAHRGYTSEGSGTIEQYWWRCWLHRKASLVEHYHAQKRDIRREELIGLHMEDVCDVPYEVDIMPAAPAVNTAEVWYLLAEGYTPTEVMQCIGKRRYYDQIGSMRTDNIRDLLYA